MKNHGNEACQTCPCNECIIYLLVSVREPMRQREMLSGVCAPWLHMKSSQKIPAPAPYRLESSFTVAIIVHAIWLDAHLARYVLQQTLP